MAPEPMPRCPFVIDGECPCLMPEGHRGLHLCRHCLPMDGPAPEDPS